jgi:hypothetical protein
LSSCNSNSWRIFKNFRKSIKSIVVYGISEAVDDIRAQKLNRMVAVLICWNQDHRAGTKTTDGALQLIIDDLRKEDSVHPSKSG